MNFATLQGLTIPEGIVTKITDASGRILWNAVKNVKVTITHVWEGMDGDTASITITSPSPFAPDPTNPSNKVTTWTVSVYDEPNCTIEVPVGSTIECAVSRDKGNADSCISLNGTKMATGEGTYTYTVVGNVSIDLAEKYVQGDYGVISITGAVTHISFIINGETYQGIEGMTWKAWFASSYNTTGETKGDVKDANGNEVSLDAVIVGDMIYEVGFTVTITLSGVGKAYQCCVYYNEVQYYNANTLIVSVGDTIRCKVGKTTKCRVCLNGTTVLSSEGNYNYTVVSNATITFTHEEDEKSYIDITEH